MKSIIKLWPKQAVGYTSDHGQSDEQCSKCIHYIRQYTCNVVMGAVLPGGWCRKFKEEQ